MYRQLVGFRVILRHNYLFFNDFCGLTVSGPINPYALILAPELVELFGKV